MLHNIHVFFFLLIWMANNILHQFSNILHNNRQLYVKAA